MNKQTRDSLSSTDGTAFNYRIYINKASITALFPALFAHIVGPTKTWTFQPLFRIGGFCNTPCVAVMSIYSAVSPSHESELHNALCSAMTATIGLGSLPHIPPHDYSLWLTCNVDPSSPADGEINTDRHGRGGNKRDNVVNTCPVL